MNVAIPIPIGGIATAAAIGPITSGLPAVIIDTPNKNAVLLTGPPISNAIIAPKIVAKTTELVPDKHAKKLVKLSNTIVIGPPKTNINAKPVTNVDMIGIIMIGIIGLIIFGTFIDFNPLTI